MLTLPIDSSLPYDYAVEFNKKVQVSFLSRGFFYVESSYSFIIYSFRILLGLRFACLLYSAIVKT